MFDKYPYTDFHEMNLDWIIETVKDMENEWDSMTGNVEAEAHVSSTPSVDVEGNLKTGLVFDFGLVQGPRGYTGPEGPRGEKGDTGEGLNILDTYPTLAALQSAHPTGSSGDAYLVGSDNSYTLYIWSPTSSAWVEGGALTSPQPASAIPLMDSTASIGSAIRYAREDHIHPSDSTKVNVADYQSEMSAINTALGTAQQDIADTQEDLEALTNRVTSAETSITSMASDIQTVRSDLTCLVLKTPDISALPYTINNLAIKPNHVVVNSILSKPSAQTSYWTVETSSGSLTISGSISGSTAVSLYLALS